MKKFYLLFLLISWLFFSDGCSSPTGAPASPHIRIGLLRIEDSMPFFTAEHEDLFTLNNVQVELVPFSNARERDLALEAGEIHGELADLLAAALLKKGGTPVKVVSLGLGATPQEGRFVILSAPGSGINSPDQLAGIPIAVSRNTIIQYLAEEMLAEKGLPPQQIQLQNIPDLNLRFEALLEGQEVKAALLPDPLATLAEAHGARVVVDDTQLESNLSQTVILFREEILQNRPEAVKSILRSYRESCRRLNDTPALYKELFLEKARIPQDLENSYQIPHYSPPMLPQQGTVERVMGWMSSANAAAEKGLLEQPYTYEELVAPGFLES